MAIGTPIEQLGNERSHWLRREIHSSGEFTRKRIVVASGAGDLETGTVLGKVTASGKYAPYDPAASDGREAVAGIIYDGVDATAEDQDAVLVAGQAVIVPIYLRWHTTVDDQAKIDTGISALEALGFQTRQAA